MVTISELPQNLKTITDGSFINEPLLEYIISVAKKICPNIVFDFDKLWTLEQGGTLIFLERYFNGEIDTSFKDGFLSNVDLQNTLTAFSIDPSKFWYLILFLKDYVDDETCGRPISDNAYEAIEKLVDKMYGMGFQNDPVHGDYWGAEKSGELSFRIGSGKHFTITDDKALYAISCALRRFLKSEKPQREIAIIDGKAEELNYYQIDPLNEHLFTISIKGDEEGIMDASFKIKRFAEYMLDFLKPYKSSNKNWRISIDKKLLTSRVVYTIGYTSDMDFNKRKKDDGVTDMNKLKNLLNGLKGKDSEYRYQRTIYV